MGKRRIRTALSAVALASWLPLIACPPAQSTPLYRDADPANDSQASPVASISAADLVQADAANGLIPGAPMPSALPRGSGRQGVAYGSVEIARGLGEVGFNFGPDLEPAAIQSRGSLGDFARGLINVNPGNRTGTAARPRARGAEPNAAPPVDLGIDFDAWIRDSVRDVLTSALNVSKDERGRTSFSIFGMGDFSVIVSADRGEVALTAGDDVLITGRRSIPSHEGGNAVQASYSQSSWGVGAATSGRSTGSGDPLLGELRRALELAREIATHPLSFVVYALIASYALIWTLLSGRKKRSMRAVSTAKHESRSHVHAHADAHRSPAAVPAPAHKKVRKRIRTRVRVRKYHR